MSSEGYKSLASRLIELFPEMKPWGPLDSKQLALRGSWLELSLPTHSQTQPPFPNLTGVNAQLPPTHFCTLTLKSSAKQCFPE